MKDKYGTRIRLGDCVKVTDSVGIFLVSQIYEDRDSISYLGANKKELESSSGAECRVLCDFSG